MSHRSFAESVLSGSSLSHESFAFDVTALEYIRNVLLNPFGRGYAGQWWQGMQRPAGVVGHRMQRIIEDDGTHFYSSDDVEYLQRPDKIKFVATEGTPSIARTEQLQQVAVSQPWRRLTPKRGKGTFVGAERRARLRAERAI